MMSAIGVLWSSESEYECVRIMVNFCAVVGCDNRSDREKEISFYRLPAVIFHQGDKTLELSQKRRDLWLTRIHREDLGPEKYPYTRTCICSLHFVSGNLSALASYPY